MGSMSNGATQPTHRGGAGLAKANASRMPTVPAAIVQPKANAPRMPAVPAAIVQPKANAPRMPAVPAAIVQPKANTPRTPAVPAAIVQPKVNAPRTPAVPAAIVQPKANAPRALAGPAAMGGSMRHANASEHAHPLVVQRRAAWATAATGRPSGMVAQPFISGLARGVFGASVYTTAGKTEAELWRDAVPTNGGFWEDPGNAGARVLAATNALKLLPNARAGVIDQILLQNDGQAPRAIGQPAVEDGISGGHTDDRHVFTTGGGINNIDHLAMRVARHKLNGGGNAPCPGKAGAFANPAAAKSAIEAAVKRDWSGLRHELAFGVGANVQTIIGGVQATGTVLVKTDAGPPAKYPVVQLPPYADPLGRGGRPMHPDENLTTRMAPYLDPLPVNASYFQSALHWAGVGHTYSAGGVAIALQPTNPLTTKVQPSGVEIRLLRDAGANGGFQIHSAWPT